MNEVERMIDLEVRFTHMDLFIEQLNSIVIEQQKSIEKLEKELIDLKRSVNAEGVVSANRSLKDDVPPHY
jgi:SlyX protein